MLLFEALFVGLYTFFIYCGVFTVTNKMVGFCQPFLVGFFKHFLGYVFGIQSFYCQNIHMVKDVSQNRSKKKYFIYFFILATSLLEGISFVLMHSAIHRLFFNLNEGEIYFVIGVALHIMAEFSGIHTFFCKNAV